MNPRNFINCPKCKTKNFVYCGFYAQYWKCLNCNFRGKNG